MKTATQIRKEMQRKGITVVGWAAHHGYTTSQVHDVLRGKAIGTRGAAHEIAVLMGLKSGEIVDSPELGRRAR
jgi:gp16 family phage-associated protein